MLNAYIGKVATGLSGFVKLGQVIKIGKPEWMLLGLAKVPLSIFETPQNSNLSIVTNLDAEFH